MLDLLFDEGIALGFAQAGVVCVLAAAMALVARGRGIHIERETLVALGRGLVQITVIGLVFVVLMRGPAWVGVFVLAAMIVAATVTSIRREKEIAGAFRASLFAMTLGAGGTIAVMTLVGVIDTEITSLVPVGSMLISNAMNANAQALERFRSSVVAHSGQVETALALGATPASAVVPYIREAVDASLIARVDMLRSLGIVWIPGLMAGMILSGTDPVYAAIYQFSVIAMIFVSSGITSILSTNFIRSRYFSKSDQLLPPLRGA